MGTKYIPVILLICSFCCTGLLKAQDKGIYDTVRVYAYITPEGDTIGESWLPSVEVIGKLNAAGRKYWAEWTRLRNAVYVTYPYAKAASRIINEINLQLVNVSDKQMRRKIIRSREKEMKKQFTDQLTKLSVYQGRVLMKLINRETGNNCYEIIEEYKGFITAAFWQTVAFVFGSNLKQPYDPGTKDAEMEKIVRDVARMYGYPG
ncbi:DUF4294 domain-containing protein [Sediminibacterium sp.]|uniref:DUF4294 domain-containing protein n=1 Tax=Sediminibacterium sp. TaxID=1917865 RepID=UPI003F69E0EE